MKDLGITKGEWWPCCKETRPHFIFVGEEEGTICGIHHNDPSEDNYDPLQRDIPTTERIANALLIADAGNTAQKCGLLPSELLRQQDELRERCKQLEFMIEKGLGWDDMKNDITMPHEL